MTLDDVVVPASQVILDGLFIGLEWVLLDGPGLENMDSQATPSVDNSLSIYQQPKKSRLIRKVKNERAFMCG